MEGDIVLDQTVPHLDLAQCMEQLGNIQFALMQCRRTVEWLGSDDELDRLAGNLLRCTMSVDGVRKALIGRYYEPLQQKTDADMVKPEIIETS